MMKEMRKRLTALLGGVVMALGLLAPAATVEAATTNKAIQIPISFAEDYTSTGTVESRTHIYITEDERENRVAYSEGGYKVSFKLYIPSSILAGKTEIGIGMWADLHDQTLENENYGGSIDTDALYVRSDKKVMTRNEETDWEPVEVNYATVAETGDFYVVTVSGCPYKYNYFDGAECDITQSAEVDLDFSFAIFDDSKKLTVSNAVYLDNLEVTTADGTVLISNDYDSVSRVDGDYHIAPNWEVDGTPLSLATITDNKVLNVKSTKLSVKVGKKKTISATTPNDAKVTYTSSDKKVATVNAKGVVTGKKAGTATISVTANGKTVEVKVTVKKK